MMMTNYNDGKWHGWNGGECPVHSQTVVDYVWFDEGDEDELCGTTKGRAAYDAVAWGQVVKFRVVKEHKEPREFWVTPKGGLIPVGTLAAFGWTTEECFKVREVME